MESTELIPLIVIGVGLMLLLAMAFVLFFAFSQGKFRKEQVKAQQAQLEYQEQLLHSNLQTQEAERERIAKDLHDEVGSKLNVVHLYLHQLGRKAPEAKSSINEMLAVIGDTIQTTRRISHDLLPPTLDSFGLQVAIDELCESLQQNSPLDIHFEGEGERPDEMDKLVEINLFRILQELLSNTLKYAQASEVRILLWQSPERMSLSYADNGQGFEVAAQENQMGLGMKNIQSRLRMIGGKMDLQSAPGKGISVSINVKHSIAVSA